MLRARPLIFSGIGALNVNGARTREAVPHCLATVIQQDARLLSASLGPSENNCSFLWCDGIVPIAVKRVACEID